jgi:NAD(P)-dependent dehydrogenase (short-subunit alcohol dehydrogenase family)
MAGRVIVLTGASRGLGLAMAQALAEDGHTLVVASQTASAPLAALAARHPSRIIVIEGDLTQDTVPERLVATAVAEFGRLDGLVNNAARGMDSIAGPEEGRLPLSMETSVADWRAMFEMNLLSVFALTLAAAPHLRRVGGRVVNISTSLRTMTRHSYAPYGPSKAALEAASAIWAQELAPDSVAVNVLCPGAAVNTRMITEREGIPRSRLLSPDVMNAACRWLIGAAPPEFTARRLIARDWDPSLPPEEAALSCSTPLIQPPG